MGYYPQQQPNPFWKNKQGDTRMIQITEPKLRELYNATTTWQKVGVIFTMPLEQAIEEKVQESLVFPDPYLLTLEGPSSLRKVDIKATVVSMGAVFEKWLQKAARVPQYYHRVILPQGLTPKGWTAWAPNPGQTVQAIQITEDMADSDDHACWVKTPWADLRGVVGDYIIIEYDYGQEPAPQCTGRIVRSDIFELTFLPA